MATSSTVRSVVIVEGASDAAAVHSLAALIGCDLVSHHIDIRQADGVSGFSRVLSASLRAHPRAHICGIYDIADESHVRRALVDAAIPLAALQSLDSFGFFACVLDLEDELIRALGPEAVEAVLAAQAELRSFRRFQAMPQHRGEPVHQQLRRFLGTRATRKIRSARRLVQALDVAQLPDPLIKLAARLLWPQP